jgi:hypothetical protein
MPDSGALVGLGVQPSLAQVLGDVPQVIVAKGTTQAGAVALLSNNTSINAQTSNTGVYLPTATQAATPDTLLFCPYYLNYSTLSAASPVIYVGVGGYLNGVLNGSITLAAGQAAIAWQQAPGIYYSNKTA